MRYGKCFCCKKIGKLINGYKICILCVEGLKKSFIYGIGGKQVSREHYNAIIKRGFVIPEELEDIRNENI